MLKFLSNTKNKVPKYKYIKIELKIKTKDLFSESSGPKTWMHIIHSKIRYIRRKTGDLKQTVLTIEINVSIHKSHYIKVHIHLRKISKNE